MGSLNGKNKKNKTATKAKAPGEKKEKKGLVPPFGKKKPEGNPDLKSVFDLLPDEKDALSPSVIKEIDGDDENQAGDRVNDYYVEVGSTIDICRYFRSFHAKLMGENTYFGMMSDLYLGQFGDSDADVALHVQPADDAKTRYVLSRKIASLEADLINESNTVKQKEINDQLRELHTQEERLRKNIEKLYAVSVQATVSNQDFDQMKKFSNTMVKRMTNQGMFFKAADTQQLEGLMAMTPLGSPGLHFNHTYKNLETSNLADMFPFGFGTISHNSGVIIGTDIFGKPVFYNDRHPGLQNYNSITFGVSGSGKSMSRKILQARKLMQSETMTTIIDYELENKGWITELGYPYLEFRPGASEYTINVFPVPRTVKNKKGDIYVDLDDAMNTVYAIVIKMLLITSGESPAGSKKILIKEAIQKCYEVQGINHEPDSLYENNNTIQDGIFSVERRFKPMPQLINLYEVMHGTGELKGEALIIKSFTKAGNIRSQSVFDCQSNVDISRSLAVGFSVDGLDDIMKPLGLYVCSSFAWSTYERLPKIVKKDIIIDEAQNMMQGDEEADWLENRYRIARRRNIGMHAITQGFEVFLRKKQGLGIMKNASTKFLFRQDGLDIEAVENKFNLPDGAKGKLLGFDAGECILIVGNEMALLKTNPTQSEYGYFTTNPNEEVEEVV